MARVLVVGADIQGETALLQRLRRASALPEQDVRSCHDLDTCDLLVIKDTPALRRAAQRLLEQRPRLRCWIEDTRGRLLADGGRQATELDDGAIRRALHDMRDAAQEVDALALASGAHAITRLLRERLPQRQGHLLLSDGELPLLLLDLHAEQAIVLHEPTAGLVERLAHSFPVLQLHALTASRLLALAGHRPRQPLRPLLWQWAQRSPHWQALDQRLRQDAVKLERWPDFRVLGHDHDGFRLCSLLLKRASTVQECASLLDLPAQAVRDFVHAAYLCGYARIEPRPAVSRSSVRAIEADGQGNLLARMWRAMRGGR